MRSTGTWMTALDERILEYLREEGWGSPTTIEADRRFHASRSRIRERFRALAHAELIRPFMDSVEADTFEISGWGELYLQGELDAELLRPDPKPRPPHASRSMVQDAEPSSRNRSSERRQDRE